MGYYFFKYWISIGLFCYYRSIKAVGFANIPRNGPVIFLSNHQNALMDVLLIATRCGRKPWFLARSDIFKSPIFRPLFRFLQMMPIYRMRDGKKALDKNQDIFDQCGQLLNGGEVLLVFPEANHSLKRRVRPLSKGFTRIVFNAIHKNTRLDLQLVPLGQNYRNPMEAGDSAAIQFGAPIAVQPRLRDDRKKTALLLKSQVGSALQKLTTHISDESNYEAILSALERRSVDFLSPNDVNDAIGSLRMEEQGNAHSGFSKTSFAKVFFYMFNFPMALVWRTLVRPTVPEDEFMATFRFVFAMLVYPLFYLSVFVMVASLLEWKTACLIIILHAALNLLFVKVFGITSYGRKR